MLNIIGTFLGFIGSVVAVFDIITSKPDPKGITWGELEDMGKNNLKSKRLNIWGLSLMGIGFVLQLIDAILNYLKGCM